LTLFRLFTIIVLCFLTVTYIGCAKRDQPDKGGESSDTMPAETHTPAASDVTAADSMLTPGEAYVPGDKQLWPDEVTFSRPAMNRVTMMRAGNLQAIYHRNRERLGNPEGTVTLHFTIFPDVSVSDVTVQEQTWDEPADELGDSMAVEMATWTYPPGLDKVTGATQTFRFTPQEQDR
jgi:hypothetical protein